MKEQEHEDCTLPEARFLVRAGYLRGIVECPIHGHHNPYHMHKTGEDMDDSPPLTLLKG